MKKKILIAVLLLALIGGAVLAVKHKRTQVAERPVAGIPAVVVTARQLAAGPVTLSLPASVVVLAILLFRCQRGVKPFWPRPCR